MLQCRYYLTPYLWRCISWGKYEFSLRQEVLLEKGASVLGDLFRFKRQHGITDQADPISVLYGLVWSAKQEILISETETELEQIEGQFNLANRFIAKMAGGLNE